MATLLRWAACLAGAIGGAFGCAQEVPFDSTGERFSGADAASDAAGGSASVLGPGNGGIYVASGGSLGGMTGLGFGGTPSAGGEPGAGGDTGNGCPDGSKRCGGVCVTPQPPIGCSMTDCAACPEAPQNSEAMCMGEACTFLCHDGFQPSADGTFCEVPAPPGAGGAGAGGAPPVGNGGSAPVGSGGTAPSCTPSGCPDCSLLLQPCCTPSGQCGCEGTLGLIDCR